MHPQNSFFDMVEHFAIFMTYLQCIPTMQAVIIDLFSSNYKQDDVCVRNSALGLQCLTPTF